jgi:hypothetical protein
MIYLDPELKRALEVKAAANEQTVSDVVNEAVRLALLEDAEDLAAFEEVRDEPLLEFDEVVAALKRRGKL